MTRTTDENWQSLPAISRDVPPIVCRTTADDVGGLSNDNYTGDVAGDIAKDSKRDDGDDDDDGSFNQATVEKTRDAADTAAAYIRAEHSPRLGEHRERIRTLLYYN